MTCPPHMLRPEFFPLSGNSKLFCERCGKTQETIEAERAATPALTQPAPDAMREALEKAGENAEREPRIALWNALRRAGSDDAFCYRIIGEVAPGIERLIDSIRLEAAEAAKDAVIAAYQAGALDVHNNWQEDSDPDFTEAAHDYAAALLAKDGRS